MEGSSSDKFPDEFEAFLQHLQKRVGEDDVQGVADMVDFKIGMSREEFLRLYRARFTPCLRRALECTVASEVGENYLGAFVAYGGILVTWRSDVGFQVADFMNHVRCERGSKPGR